LGNADGGDKPERIYAANTSANYFDLLGIRPLKGRFFMPGEEANEGGAPYIVLGLLVVGRRNSARVKTS